MTVQNLIETTAFDTTLGIADAKYYTKEYFWNDGKPYYDNFDIIDTAYNIHKKKSGHLENRDVLNKEVHSISYCDSRKGDLFSGILVLYEH